MVDYTRQSGREDHRRGTYRSPTELIMYSWLLKLATPVIMGWVRTGLVGLAVYLTAKGYIAPADQAGLVASAMVLAGMGFSAGSKILAHQKTTAAVAVAAAEYPVGVASEAPLVGQIPAVAI